MTNEQIQALQAAAEMAAGSDEYGVARRALEYMAKPELILSLLAERAADKALIAKLQNEVEETGQLLDRVTTNYQSSCQRIAELEASHSKLRDSMAAIHNTIQSGGAYTPLASIMNASKRAYEESSAAAGITLVVGGE